MYPQDTIDRFWTKVNKGSPDECWMWQGGKQGTGYGWFERKLTHRMSYEICHDETIPSGMLVIHSCDTPACVNPAHLRIGTHQDNAIDMIDRNRHPIIGRGVSHSQSKLTGSDILLLRRIYASGNWTQEELALGFDIRRETVSDIVTNQMWKHLPHMPRKFVNRLGERHPDSKLTNEQVLEIRHLYNKGKRGQRELGRMFGVDGKTIHHIVHRRLWKHI